MDSNTTKLIQQIDDEFSASYNKGDYQGVADLYSNNCNLLPIGTSEFVPKDGIKDFFQESAEMGLADVTLTANTTMQLDANTIYEIGQVSSGCWSRHRILPFIRYESSLNP